ncbi:MAG: zinc ribbon domain-containing protein [Planctomycetota bacterium]
MPTYDYRCKACGHTFDEFQMMSDPVLRKCPKCGKLKLERLIGGGAGFVFKGSGYYVTDYRSKGYDDAKKADGPSKDSGGSDSGSSGSSSSGSTSSESGD